MGIDPLQPPLLTPELPGVGGRIKQECEDFEVEEVPAYEPSGVGSHLYLWVEKRDLGAEYFQRQVARRLGIANGEVGVAGLKDRRAVTRQWVSVPEQCEGQVPALEGDGIRVLRVSRHENKLKAGHLRGNRFRILVRGADASRQPALEQVVARVREQGLPNYYGPQRFGIGGETATLGMALLKGEAARAPRNPFLRKLALSAAQSVLFNADLGGRLQEGLFRTVLPGEVMMKWPFGGIFTAEDLPVEQARFDRRETVHAGPIFGRKMFPAHGECQRREQRILEEYGLTREHFAGHGKLVSGTRRHRVIYVDDLRADWEPDGLRVQFTLPSGSYATVLLRELMKQEVGGEAGDEPPEE